MQDKTSDTEALLQQLTTFRETDAITEDFRKKLSAGINDLISDNFEKLVQLLYRLDVDEAKLKETLRENAGHDAGELIAGLIIERQLQKLKSRKQFNQPNDTIDENEKW